MPKADLVETLCRAAGIDYEAAKKALHKLDEDFQGEAGDIPSGALQAWADEHFNPTVARRFFFQFGRVLEDEHFTTVPESRKWERGPDAAKIKAETNLKKAAKK